MIIISFYMHHTVYAIHSMIAYHFDLLMDDTHSGHTFLCVGPLWHQLNPSCKWLPQTKTAKQQPLEGSCCSSVNEFVSRSWGVSVSHPTTSLFLGLQDKEKSQMLLSKAMSLDTNYFSSDMQNKDTDAFLACRVQDIDKKLCRKSQGNISSYYCHANRERWYKCNEWQHAKS